LSFGDTLGAGMLLERLPGNTRGRKLWPLRPPRLVCRGALGLAWL